MYYVYRAQPEHGAYATSDNPEFPMPLKSSYLLLSVRERIAANLIQEAESGNRQKGKAFPDVEKARVLHEVQQQELNDFTAAHHPTSKTELQVLRILDRYAPSVIDK